MLQALFFVMACSLQTWFGASLAPPKSRCAKMVLIAKLGGRILGDAEPKQDHEDQEAFLRRLEDRISKLMPHNSGLPPKFLNVEVVGNNVLAFWDDVAYNNFIYCPLSQSGNCQHEDNPNVAACSCPPCPNAPFCQVFHTPEAYLAIHGGVHFNCAVTFGKGKQLDFVDNQECASCRATTLCVKHPKCIQSIQHKFCVACLRALVWGKGWDVDPKEYGFWLDDPEDDAPEQEHADYDQAFHEWQSTDGGIAYKVEMDIEEQTRWASIKLHCVKC